MLFQVLVQLEHLPTDQALRNRLWDTLTAMVLCKYFLEHVSHWNGFSGGMTLEVEIEHLHATEGDITLASVRPKLSSGRNAQLILTSMTTMTNA